MPNHDHKQHEARDNDPEGTLEELSKLGQAAASVEAEGQSGQYSHLRVSIAHGDRVSKKRINIPKWEFFKLEKALVQKNMAKAFESVQKDSPVFFTSLPPSMSSSDILPGRIAVRTFDNSARFTEDHVRNLEKLQAAKLDARNTKFFNFVAPPKVSGRSKEPRWAKLRKSYDTVATTLGLPFGAGKEELLATLMAGNTDIVVIVAHGDKSSIHLPDGTSLTASDVLNLPTIKNERAPIVVFLSCETGNSSDNGITTIAEALMLRGRASAVIAPTRKVPAGRQTAEVLNQIIRSAEDGDLGGFMKRLRGPWQVIVEATKGKLLQSG